MNTNKAWRAESIIIYCLMSILGWCLFSKQVVTKLQGTQMVPGYLNKLLYAKNEGNPKEKGKELNFFSYDPQQFIQIV